MRIYDAHTHLNGEELYPKREEYLTLFTEAGGAGIINSGASDDYNMK
jgi:predicted urease superfamily metal-dependent hydrolase